MLFLGQGRFRHFNAEIFPRDIVVMDDIFDDGKGVHQIEIMARQVERHGQGRFLIDQTVMHVLAYAADDIAVQFMDEPGPFQDGNENPRRKLAVYGVIPAGQRFQTADFPGHGPDDGLVVDLDVALFHGIVEVFQDKSPFFQGFSHIPRIHRPAAGRIHLNRIAGHFGHVKGVTDLPSFALFQEADAGFQADIGIMDIRVDFAADDFNIREQILPRRQHGKAICRHAGHQGRREMLTQGNSYLF